MVFRRIRLTLCLAAALLMIAGCSQSADNHRNNRANQPNKILYAGSDGILSYSLKANTSSKLPRFILNRAMRINSTPNLVTMFSEVNDPRILSESSSPRHMIFVWGQKHSEGYSLYCTNDGGKSWSAVPVKKNMGPLCPYAIIYDAANPKNVYIFETNPKRNIIPAVYTVNAGQNWHKFLLAGSVPKGICGIEFDPSNNKNIWIWHYGMEVDDKDWTGIGYSEDEGLHWGKIDIGKESNADVYNIIINPKNSEEVIFLGKSILSLKTAKGVVNLAANFGISGSFQSGPGAYNADGSAFFTGIQIPDAPGKTGIYKYDKKGLVRIINYPSGENLSDLFFTDENPSRLCLVWAADNGNETAQFLDVPIQ